MERKVTQNTQLSIIGKQPCGNFAVQQWIDEQVNKLPENHTIVKTLVQIFISPMKHTVTLQLYIESEDEEGEEHLTKKGKTWTIDYDDAEKFYRMMEKMS